MLTCPISCLFLKEYKLFERDIRKEKWEEIGVEGSDNMFMTNTVDDNFEEN